MRPRWTRPGPALLVDVERRASRRPRARPSASQSRSRAAAISPGRAVVALGDPIGRAPRPGVPGSTAGRTAGRCCTARRRAIARGCRADHVVRWRCDVCESADPGRGITDTAERVQDEPGASAGRKVGLPHHVRSAGRGSWDSPYLENFAQLRGPGTGRLTDGAIRQAAAAGPRRRRPDRARRSARLVHHRAWNCSARAARPPRPRSCSGAANAEPDRRSIREPWPGPQFDTGQYEAAAANFRAIVKASPADDYAQFGLGLALARCGEPEAAAETSPWPPPCTPTASPTPTPSTRSAPPSSTASSPPAILISDR